MIDALLVLVLLVFFGLCVLYVQACDRMIRNDDISDPAAALAREDGR